MSRRRARPVGRLVVERLVLVILVLAALQVAVATDILSPLAVATPTSTIAALVQVVFGGAMWGSLGLTLVNWLVGVVLAAVVGIPLGLVLGSNDSIYAAFRVPIEFMRTVPAIAILPLALLILGVTPKMAIFLVFIGALWPILLQSMYGFHEIDPVLRDVTQSYRIGRADRFTRVILPSAAPFIATGMRISLTVGLLLAIAAEMIAGVPGLGSEVATAQQNGLIPQMYAYVAVIAALGTLANFATHRVERSLLKWHPSRRLEVRA